MRISFSKESYRWHHLRFGAAIGRITGQIGICRATGIEFEAGFSYWHALHNQIHVKVSLGFFWVSAVMMTRD